MCTYITMLFSLSTAHKFFFQLCLERMLPLVVFSDVQKDFRQNMVSCSRQFFSVCATNLLVDG